MVSTLLIMVLLLLLRNCDCDEMEVSCAHRDTQGLRVWNCSNTNVYEFPDPSIHIGIETIDFSYNHISHLPQLDQEQTDRANCSGHLQRLFLHHNVIESLDDDTFQMLPCLEVLDLSYNHMSGEKFTAKTLQGLHRLKILNLQGNPLIVLKDASLDLVEVGGLEYFDASRCQIKTIETNAFDHLRFLKFLNLSRNDLSDLDMNIFRGLNFLHKLDLRFNKFTNLPNKTFYALMALKHLHLDSNQISDIHDGAFHGLDRLELLTLRDNRLGVFPFTALFPFKSLKQLDVSKNSFSSLNEFKGDDIKVTVENFTMEDMPRLRYIGPRATKIFPNLKYLCLRSNQLLNNIAAQAFTDSFKNLQYVYINDNGLTTIDSKALPWKTLLDLNWSGNPWNCDCYLKWMISKENINKTLICHQPTKFEGHDLMELHPLDLKCPRSLLLVFFGFSITLILALLASASVIAWRYKHRLRCLRKKETGYVSVYSNEGADEESSATILTRPEDERPLTSDMTD